MDAKSEVEDSRSDAKSPDAKASNGSTTTQEEVVQLVMEFATGNDFERDFEEFAEAHSKTFESLLDLKPGDEHPMEWHDVYLVYLHTFEDKIERFIESNGYKIHDFYEKAKEILEDTETFGEVRFFLEALMATAEYEAFIYLMKGEMFTRAPKKVNEIFIPVDNDSDYKGDGEDEKSDAKD